VIKTTLNYKDFWLRRTEKRKIDLLRWKYSWKCPQPVAADPDRAREKFIAELEKNSVILEKVFGDLYQKLEDVKRKLENREKRAFPDYLWAQAVYLHVAAYRDLGPEVLNGLYALWLGKVASHILDTLDIGDKEAEERVEEYARAFEEERGLLEEVLS